MHEADSSILILIFVAGSLVIGAGVRQLLKHAKLPYTVVLLMIGLALGLIQRADGFGGLSPTIGAAIELVGEVDSHIILFVFLPTLLFESAFAMEVHLFKRMLSQIVTLAVPGLIFCTLATAALVKLVFPWDWSWAVALMFGALISATDPVAVVSLLKEVSSRKRLETLIEGESLLNDGTAIVAFTLFYALAVGAGGGFSALGVSGEFIRVVLLGIGVGLVIGGLAIYWIGRIFNDPLIEITVTIAAAYLTFFFAEQIHVSGVVAVVTLALLFASVGRTRISPEVEGFLHHFWEMMAHIANTLIFLLVGILIAEQVAMRSVEDFLYLGVLYLGIMVIRGLSVALLFPLLKRIGIGITRDKSLVLIWGGLRGAVSLALALSLANDPAIVGELGSQILFLCAGIVILTMFINATTMGYLLRWLNLDRLPAAKQEMVDRAEARIDQALNQQIPRLQTNEFLYCANWQDVRQSLGLTPTTQPPATSSSFAEDVPCSDAERRTAFRRRLLETERQNYWTQFSVGWLPRNAVQHLVEAVEQALDGEPEISPRPTLQRAWKTPMPLALLQRIPMARPLALRLSFSRVALGYNLARGFIHAQEELLDHLPALAPTRAEADEVGAMILANKRLAYELVLELRLGFPELISAIETQMGKRVLLNQERGLIREMVNAAVLDKAEAQRMTAAVEHLMANTRHFSTQAGLPEGEGILKQLPWARDLAEETRNALTESASLHIYNTAEYLTIEPGTLAIVCRGSVELLSDQSDQARLIDLRGPGTTLGVEKLFGEARHVVLRTASPVEVVWIAHDALEQSMHDDPALKLTLQALRASESRLWDRMLQTTRRKSG